MVELVLKSMEAGLDVPQAFAEGELSKRHREKLIPTREAANAMVSAVANNAAPKAVARQKIQEL